MAIKANNAIRTGRLLIGTPYNELDCINFLKKVIRASFGGVKDYTTAGTNALWDSYDASAKYRDLTWRQESIAGARAGMLAFKRNGSDVHHVGLVTGMGMVLHSSSTQGGRGVVETPLFSSEGWNLLAVHRYITVEEGESEMIIAEVPKTVLYKAIVKTNKDPLRVRVWPETGTIIGSVPKGRTVEVLSDAGDGWPMVRYGDTVGYVLGTYLKRIDEEEETGGEEIAVAAEEAVQEDAPETVTIIDAEGNVFRPVGDFKVLRGSID